MDSKKDKDDMMDTSGGDARDHFVVVNRVEDQPEEEPEKNIAKFVVKEAEGRGTISLNYKGKKIAKNFVFTKGQKGQLLNDIFENRGDNPKIWNASGDEFDPARAPEALEDGGSLEVAGVKYVLQSEQAISNQGGSSGVPGGAAATGGVNRLQWGLERCSTGFVPPAAWDFDPTQPAVRASVRSNETKNGFPFDHAYFSVWRGDKAFQFLQEIIPKGSAIFRAPPYSGKTAIMQCIAIIASKTQGRKVFPLSFMGFQSFHETKKATLSLTEIFEAYWLSVSGYTYSDWKERAATNGAILLLDEIQVLYEYDLEKLFWTMVREWESKNVTVIAAAVYTAKIVTAALSGHVVWGKEYFVGDLRLTLSEQMVLFDRFNQCNKVGDGLLSTRTAEWIRHNTFAHVGFTREFLDGLEDYAKVAGLQGDVAAARYLASAKPFDAIKSCRGYPPASEWNGNMREACAILLANTPVNDGFAGLDKLLSYVVDFKDKAIYPLLKLGVLSLVDKTVIDFSSPVMHYLCAKELTGGSQLVKISGIDSLVVEIVRRLQPQVLQKAFSFSTMHDARLGEPVWRAELHRAALVCLGSNHTIMPEVGHIVNGQISPDGQVTEIPGLVDFFVNGEYSWALEVMREGYGISDHLGRFVPSGMYADLLVNDYRVIDFRHHSKKARTHHTHLLTVQYNDNFTEFTISGGALQTAQHIKCDLSHVSEGITRNSWWSVFPRWWN